MSDGDGRNNEYVQQGEVRWVQKDWYCFFLFVVRDDTFNIRPWYKFCAVLFTRCACLNRGVNVFLPEAGGLTSKKPALLTPWNVRLDWGLFHCSYTMTILIQLRRWISNSFYGILLSYIIYIDLFFASGIFLDHYNLKIDEMEKLIWIIWLSRNV